MASNPTNSIETFLEIIQILHSPTGISTKLELVSNQLARALGAVWASIIILDDNRQKTHQVYCSGEGWSDFQPQYIKDILSIEPKIKSDEGSWINNYEQSIRLFKLLYQKNDVQEENKYSGLVRPLILNGQVTGIISVARESSRTSFTFEDWELLTGVSGYIDLIIQNQFLTHSEKKQRDQAATLREVARVLNSSLDLQTVLEIILDQLAMVIEYDSASVMLFSNERFQLAAHRKLQTLEQQTFQGLISDFPHIKSLKENRDTVIIKDTHHDPRWRDLPETGYIHCWLGVPLIGKNEVIGFLSLDKEQSNYYSEESSMLASAFANQASMAIENARYYTSIQSQLRQLDALRETIADISAELQLTKLLEAILMRATILLNATGGDLGLFDETNQTINIVASYMMGIDFRGIQLSSGEGAMGRAINSRKPVIIEDYSAWEHASDKYPRGTYHSVIAVPFMIGSRVIGAIGIMDKDPHRIFSQEDEYILRLFAQHAAIAVENARLFQNIEQLATIDPVTGIFNRRYLFELGHLEFVRANRFERALSVIMMDIDDFKKVNDQYGHIAGDEVLHKLAQLIRGDVREVDVVGRYGGEEFTIILPETNLSTALEIAERLRRKINKAFQSSKQNTPEITASIGVAEHSADLPNFASLVELADKALYFAKTNGRDRVASYNSNLLSSQSYKSYITSIASPKE